MVNGNGMKVFSCIAMVWGCAAALVSCGHAAPSLTGKKLVLELSYGERSFDFPQNHELRRTVENVVYYHRYDADSGELYEESRRTGDKVQDGYGYTHWRLDFSTPSAGTATLIKKHVRTRSSVRVGDSVPFKTESLLTDES